MRDLKKEFIVGLLVIAVVILMGVFAWLMGVFRPFTSSHRYHVLYQFAGGVETGSPVRVSGVKVGRVESIRFVTEGLNGQSIVPLELTISVSPSAAPSVRKDSKFFINMAGIIGERYIEITPGTSASERLTDGAIVRGVDPPRIDQLLSQGYGAFEILQQFMENNREGVSEFLNALPGFLKEVGKFIDKDDWKQAILLMRNLNEISQDLRIATKKLRSPEAQEVMERLYDLIARAHSIDKETLKQFLQEEGIRARIF